MNYIPILIVLVVGGLTVSSAAAIVYTTEDVRVVRTGTGASITVTSTGGNQMIKFVDADHGQIFQFLGLVDGSKMQIRDITNNRPGFSMLSSNGFVGIGLDNPTQQLDVNGNLLVRGDIVSNGDLCIGNCP